VTPAEIVLSGDTDWEKGVGGGAWVVRCASAEIVLSEAKFFL
jgi:hypothetical protein